MTPVLILMVILGYFILLTLISYLTGRKSDNKTFFTGNRNSPWYAVAYGMIGASLSGVTFVSVPGWVLTNQFAYMQMVFGFLFGYAVIAFVLLPLYYRLNLTSIYTYLGKRFGSVSYRTGAFYFLISRFIGASVRLFLMASVLQITIFDSWNVPFFITVFVTLFFIWLYTRNGGIKTVVWTDTLQTTFMILAVLITIGLMASELNWSIGELVGQVRASDYSRVFFWEDWNHPNHFVKQFLSGAFITIVMTGLDQDMMQKNLTCRNLKEAKLNMMSFSFVLIFVNLLFLSLGVVLLLFAQNQGVAIPADTDELFPLIATQGYLAPIVAAIFILGLVAAAYSSADSALTALTTSVCVDFLMIEEKEEGKKTGLRKRVHTLVAVIIFLIILLFELINEENVITAIYTIAGYTYGPLLGLFAFGMMTKRNIRDRWVWVPCVAAPILSFFTKEYSEVLFNGYQFGFELLILNGMLTFVGLLTISIPNIKKHSD